MGGVCFGGRRRRLKNVSPKGWVLCLQFGVFIHGHGCENALVVHAVVACVCYVNQVPEVVVSHNALQGVLCYYTLQAETPLPIGLVPVEFLEIGAFFDDFQFAFFLVGSVEGMGKCPEKADMLGLGDFFVYGLCKKGAIMQDNGFVEEVGVFVKEVKGEKFSLLRGEIGVEDEAVGQGLGDGLLGGVWAVVVNDDDECLGVEFADLAVADLPVFVGFGADDVAGHYEAEIVGLDCWGFCCTSVHYVSWVCGLFLF